MRKFELVILCAAAGLSASSLPLVAEDSCGPAGGLSFVCGVQKPEDLLQIPGTKWVITSGYAPGGSVSLIDTDAKTARKFYTAAPGQSRPDTRLYPACPAPPDVKSLSIHGIALRAAGAGLYKLYGVSHGALESIQVFAVDARGAEPSISWTGCVPLPVGYFTNAVAAYSDGAILADIQLGPGDTQPDFFAGKITGGVWEWKPGASSFQLIPGTGLAGNNGIEISRDETEFYVAASGTQSVAVYSRHGTSGPLRQVRTPWFNLDNIHWSRDRLIAAGMMYDEPACGGTRKQIADRHGDLNCHRGWVAGQLDPKTMTWTILGYGEPNPAFGGIATAAVIGGNLWLSSFQADRVAYRPLPGTH